MKLLTLLSTLCFLAVATCQSHDMIMGQATYGDVVMYKSNEIKYGFPFIVRTTDLEYPEPGHHNFGYIKAIYVKDHATDGTGGYPLIKSGGIGQRFVKIKLKSQRGYGFNFTVTIYGRY